jgi:hypothetical protein
MGTYLKQTQGSGQKASASEGGNDLTNSFHPSQFLHLRSISSKSSRDSSSLYVFAYRRILVSLNMLFKLTAQLVPLCFLWNKSGVSSNKKEKSDNVQSGSCGFWTWYVRTSPDKGCAVSLALHISQMADICISICYLL